MPTLVSGRATTPGLSSGRFDACIESHSNPNLNYSTNPFPQEPGTGTPLLTSQLGGVEHRWPREPTSWPNSHPNLTPNLRVEHRWPREPTSWPNSHLNLHQQPPQTVVVKAMRQTETKHEGLRQSPDGVRFDDFFRKDNRGRGRPQPSPGENPRPLEPSTLTRMVQRGASSMTLHTRPTLSTSNASSPAQHRQR
jgi:hypothetical protein